MSKQNAGRIVITKNGILGRTYNIKGMVGGKVPVYPFCDEKKEYLSTPILCDPTTLKVKGYID